MMMNPRTPEIAAALAACLTLCAGAAHAARLPPPIDSSDFPSHLDAQVDLGEALFWDKILSGNQNISCASCHHAFAGTGDGLSLPVGEGGVGFGRTRTTGIWPDAITERVPRNAPFIFNLGAPIFTIMFHDGRVQAEAGYPSGFNSPAGVDLPEGLESALAVQAMFPVQSGAEMAGHPGENDIADAAADGNLAGPDGVWEQLADRLKAIPEYVDMFIAAYPGEIADASDITFVHAANAIAAYEDREFRAINSPFDRYLRGEKKALSAEQIKGMKHFYGKAGCSQCHSGPLQTDMAFHAIAMPQIGPGKGDAANAGPGLGDLGRGRVTGDMADNYRFRTPSLRNTAITGPWGHDGAYDSLEAVVRHHLNPVVSLNAYDIARAVLPTAGPDNPGIDDNDFAVQNNLDDRADIAAANELTPVKLSEDDIGEILAFLQALTDPASLDLGHTIPARVPSGLPMYE
jgi:cytochrome c peroxidase